MNQEGFRFSVKPRELNLSEIEGISNQYEKRFALLAHIVGLSVSDGGMITLNENKLRKQDKLSTNPDFLVNGVYVEITGGKNLGSRKNGQRRVMSKAGLPYVQLTGNQVDALDNIAEDGSNADLESAIKLLLRSNV